MNVRIYKILMLLILIGDFNFSFGQFLNKQNVIPSSPDVAAFAKNFDIPMNLSSGIPSVSIPIATVESGIAKLPITLSYNASGIRVEETPTWVGLGFNLNTGGSITRVVRGLPDENAYGYINSPFNRKVAYVNALPILSSERFDIERNLLPRQEVDLEPDIFNFSILGYSGQFYWDQDSSSFILAPYQNLKLEVDSSLTSFKITIPNGIICFFGETESSIEQISSSETSSRVDGVSYAPEQDDLVPYKTCWHITRIVTSTGKEINFEYIREAITEYGRGGEIQAFTPPIDYQTGSGDPVPWPKPKTATFFKRIILQPVIKKITAENCDIEFIRSPLSRLDVPISGSRKALEKILVSDKYGTEVKNFVFEYDYFISNTTPLAWGVAIPFAAIAGKRLYLKSVKEGKGNQYQPAYHFEYNLPLLPDRLSPDQDYWGYYNGKGNPTGGILALMPKRLLIPGFGIPGMPYQLPITSVDGADRTIDFQFAKGGSLKSIKYPTGGFTEFFYEPNDVPLMYYNPESGFLPPDYQEVTHTFMPLIPANPPYPLFYADTFRIIKPLTKVEVTPNLPSPCSEMSSQSCRYTITIKSLTDPNFAEIIFNTTPVFYASLPKGLYQIEALVTGSVFEQPDFTVNLKWGTHPDTVNMKVGGLKLNKMRINDGLGNVITKSYQYKLPGSSSSSGILAGCPSSVIKLNDSNGVYLGIDKIVSNGFIPFTSDGQTIRYQFVTEIDSGNTNLKTDYWFNHDFGFAVLGKLTTGAPLTLRSWQNNLQIRKEIYRRESSSQVMIYKEVNSNQFDHPLEKLIGLYGGRLTPYDIASEWYYPSASSITQYGPEGTTNLQIDQNYYYNDSHLISKKIVTTSKGGTSQERIWYVGDYNNNVAFNIDNLRNGYMITLPIKSETSINGKIKNGSIIKYNQYGQPIEYYKYEGEILKDTVVHNPNSIIESGYSSKQVISYLQENPVNFIEAAGNTNSFIWGYKDIYPVASVINAESSQIAYTSFESDDTKGNWIYSASGTAFQGAVTGSQAYNLSNGAITKAGLNNTTKYIISYWSKGAVVIENGTQSNIITGKVIDGWTYHELNITGTPNIKINGSTYIDELRLYPSDAQMTTYTYVPLLGMTSKCDVSNKITYYEYDALGRLSLVRDADKNILKQFCYNYAGQPEACSSQMLYANELKSQTFTRNNCTGGMSGTVVTYTVPAATYYSTVDVATANAQALNDIITNGQSYANANGSCVAPPSCPSPSRRIINGVCTRGLIIYTSSIYEPSTGQYSCVYHYEFPDGYHSEDFLNSSSTPCL